MICQTRLFYLLILYLKSFDNKSLFNAYIFYNKISLDALIFYIYLLTFKVFFMTIVSKIYGKPCSKFSIPSHKQKKIYI